jgi:adenosylcobinamide-phosphate synthase
MYYTLIAVCIGLILDLIIGDPQVSFHPVRLIGKLISSAEKILRKIFSKSNTGEFIAGIVLVIIVTLITTAIPCLILIFAYKFNIYLYIIIESLLCYLLFAVKSLKTESMKVYKKLNEGNIEAARYEVSMIVGRDTQSLTDKGITKAAVETVAENTSDGIIAPLFFMIIGGPALGFFYKAINTMDSMVGYKNDKYLYFGRFAAKFDDVVNYIPARLSALLMILGSYILKLDSKNAWKIFCRDRFNHASPNSAQTEAVAAGALDVQLAGNAYYFGQLIEKKTIGDDIREIEYNDIVVINRLLYVTTFLGLIIFSGLKLLIILGINYIF